MKRWLTAMISLVSAFALSSPAHALMYSWTDIASVTSADGVSGHVGTGDEFSTPWQTQLVALDNGKVFALWVVSTNSVSGFAKPSTSKLYSNTYTPGLGWGTATQRYSGGTKISHLTALRLGENSIGIAFQEETYAVGATVASSIKVRLSSVSSPASLGTADTWRSISTLADSNDFSQLRAVSGSPGYITVLVDSSATINGATSTYARRFEVATQTVSDVQIPTAPANTSLETMYQSPTGPYLWLFRSLSDDVFLVSTEFVNATYLTSTSTKMNLGRPINDVHFVAAPTWDEPISGALYFDDWSGTTWMFVVNAQGALQSPHMVATSGTPTAAGIDGLGFAYIAMDVVNQDLSHASSLVAMNLSDYSSHTIQLAPNSHPAFATNLSGNVFYSSVVQSALTSGQLRGGQWVGTIGTYNWNLNAIPEFAAAGSLTEFTMVWGTQDLGIRSVTSVTSVPDPVTDITGAWTAPDEADFSWTAPNSDPDYLYNWSVDCGTFGQQQGESTDTHISLQDVGALIGCNLSVTTLQGGLQSTVAHWRLVPQTVTKVSQLKTRWVGPSSAEVKWTSSTTPAATYSVKVTATNFTRVVTSSSPSVIVNGLNPAKVYRVEVTALKFTAKSPVVAGGILAAKKASAPRDVKFSGSGAGLKLVWTAPKTNASSVYAYRVSFKVGSGKWTKLTDSEIRSVSLNRTFGAKKSVQFRVEALTGYTSPAALSKPRTTLANGRL